MRHLLAIARSFVLPYVLAFASNMRVPRVQLNTRVSPDVAKKVRADARRNNRTVDMVVETILTDFFAGWNVAERSRFYQQVPEKRIGAPIKQAA